MPWSRRLPSRLFSSFPFNRTERREDAAFVKRSAPSPVCLPPGHLLACPCGGRGQSPEPAPDCPGLDPGSGGSCLRRQELPPAFLPPMQENRGESRRIEENRGKLGRIGKTRGEPRGRRCERCGAIERGDWLNGTGIDAPALASFEYFHYTFVWLCLLFGSMYLLRQQIHRPADIAKTPSLQFTSVPESRRFITTFRTIRSDA